MQAQTLHTFLTNKAVAGRFTDISDLRTHYKQNYDMWLSVSVNEYYAYLQDNFPAMTLAQVTNLNANNA
jgi:hypothetical protein